MSSSCASSGERECYWSSVTGRLKGRADLEIGGVNGGDVGQRLLYSPHGLLSHQRSAGRLLRREAATRDERLQRVQRTEQRVANRIAGNAVAYHMYCGSPEARSQSLQWAEEPGVEEGPQGTEQQLIVHPDYDRGEFSNVAPPWFELEDVPLRELQTRLQRGEIAPRKEWVPSEDVRNRKSVTLAEAKARVEFGEKLREEADVLMKNLGGATISDVARANVLYTQGCNLLKHYVCEDAYGDIEMQSLLRLFRRNAAVTHLKLKEYRSCIAVCEEGLLFDENDGKLRWLSGRAYEHLGELQTAIRIFESLSTNGFVSDTYRAAARHSLYEAIATQREADLKKGKLVKNWYMAEPPHPPHPPATRSSTYLPRHPPTPAELQDIPLPMDPTTFINLLQDITRLYTSPRIFKTLQKIKQDAMYDEKKILIKLRDYLPPILTPVYKKYGLVGESFDELKESFRRCEYEFQVSKHNRDRALMKFYRDSLTRLLYQT